MTERLQSFSRAVIALKSGLLEFKKESDRLMLRDGLIQRFEFTVELAWKTLKKYLESLGINANNPKDVIRESLRQEIISDEKKWIGMINDRNLLFHIYDDKTPEEVVIRIENDYLKILEDLDKKLN